MAGTGCTVLPVGTALGFVWTLPNTALGLVLGLLSFQLPRVAHGLVLFDRATRGVTWILHRIGRTAMTMGFVILASEPVEGRLLDHERHHVRQYTWWGPLFIPVYLLIALRYGYRRHPFELAAVRASVGVPPAGP